MTMKKTLALSMLVASLVVAVSADAETYQWKDRSGRTVISDTPPPATAKSGQLSGPKTPYGSQVAEEKQADPAKTTAEKDMEFKKRQQEAKEKADKEAKEKALQADKRDNCERARRNLKTLESDRPVTTTDDNGERQVMDNGQREQEIERARRIASESCN